MSPAEGQRIERKASTKIHHGYDRPAIRLQYLAPAVPKMPTDQADGGGERDAPDHEVANSPNHSTPDAPSESAPASGPAPDHHAIGKVANTTPPGLLHLDLVEPTRLVIALMVGFPTGFAFRQRSMSDDWSWCGRRQPEAEHPAWRCIAATGRNYSMCDRQRASASARSAHHFADRQQSCRRSAHRRSAQRLFRSDL
jgi:hypothetical protein